jgi:hypothetical protein
VEAVVVATKKEFMKTHFNENIFNEVKPFDLTLFTIISPWLVLALFYLSMTNSIIKDYQKDIQNISIKNEQFRKTNDSLQTKFNHILKFTLQNTPL